MLNSRCEMLQTPLPGNAERELSSAASCPREGALGWRAPKPSLGVGCRGPRALALPPPHEAISSGCHWGRGGGDTGGNGELSDTHPSPPGDTLGTLPHGSKRG